MAITKADTKEILVIEDCNDDYEVFEYILSKLELPVELSRCRNGKEVKATLFSKCHTEVDVAYSSPKWGLILLDLKFPGGNGVDVLKRLRRDHRYHDIPVVVFTTSPDVEDVQRAYNAGANSYLVKPMQYQKFVELVELICTYWLDWNVVSSDFRSLGGKMVS